MGNVENAGREKQKRESRLVRMPGSTSPSSDRSLSRYENVMSILQGWTQLFSIVRAPKSVGEHKCLTYDLTCGEIVRRDNLEDTHSLFLDRLLALHPELIYRISVRRHEECVVVIGKPGSRVNFLY